VVIILHRLCPIKNAFVFVVVAAVVVVVVVVESDRKYIKKHNRKL
jgi:hypothetical protein